MMDDTFYSKWSLNLKYLLLNIKLILNQLFKNKGSIVNWRSYINELFGKHLANYHHCYIKFGVIYQKGRLINILFLCFITSKYFWQILKK